MQTQSDTVMTVLSDVDLRFQQRGLPCARSHGRQGEGDQEKRQPPLGRSRAGRDPGAEHKEETKRDTAVWQQEVKDFDQGIT